MTRSVDSSWCELLIHPQPREQAGLIVETHCEGQLSSAGW